MRRAIALSFLAVLGICGLAVIPSGETTDELQKVLRELRELRSSYYERKASLEGEIAQARETIAKVRADTAELAAREIRLKAEEEAVAGEVSALEAKRTRARATRDATLAAVRAFIDSETVRLTGVMPYRKDRRGRRLEGMGSHSTATDALAAAWAFFQTELSIARSVEVYGDEIGLPDGRQKHARLLRAGERFLGLVTEDGMDVMLWVPAEGWVADPARIAPDAIRAGIEILRRRRAPALLPLPMRTSQGAPR